MGNQIYVAPSLALIGTVQQFTRDVPTPTTKIIGGNLDGVFLKVGHTKIPLGTS